jgi:hypothetical protein
MDAAPGKAVTPCPPLKGELRPDRLFEDEYALGQKGYVNYQLEILLL